MRWLVPERLLPLLILSAAIWSVNTLVLYVHGRTASEIAFELTALVVYVLETAAGWYCYQVAHETHHGSFPLLPWLPILLQIMRGFYRYSAGHLAGRLYEVASLLPISVNITFLTFLTLALRSSLQANAAKLDKVERIPLTGVIPSTQRDAGISAPDAITPSPDVVIHTRVTEIIRARSERTSDNARLSMIIMIVLVLVGGGASVGLWFFGQLDRVRSIEVERNKLVALSSGLETLPHIAGPDQPKAIAELQNQIQFQFGQNNTYQQFLRDIAERTQTSWPDIAIRVTLAVLTLFLVQIFFAVYKYSQHLSNVLAAKAEALELLSVTPEDRQHVRNEMIALVREGVPGFGSGPNTPLQEILELLGKLRETKNAP
jgi:hypothetical protein